MTKGHYRPDIDGLRAVAVLAVLLFHAFPGRLPGGFVGVDVFFVISGYLITGIIARDADEGRASIVYFYQRRIRRIFPALIVVLAATMAAGAAILLAGDYAKLGKHVAAAAGFVANLVFWSEASYFDASATSKPLLHLWSLGVEEQFYIFWPLLVPLLVSRRISLPWAIGLISAASFALSVYLVASFPVAAFFSPLSRLWELGAGALLVAIERNGRYLPARWSTAASFGGAALVGLSLLLIAPTYPFPGTLGLPVVVGTMLVIAAGRHGFLNRTILSNPLAVGVGLISYPLYLWHWPILSFAHILTFEAPLSAATRLGLIGASVILAALTYWFIEKPLRRRRPLQLFFGMVAVGVAGAVAWTAGGLPGRSANHDERRQFVKHYQEMHREQLASYRPECDFVTWGTHTSRSAIDASCTRPNGGGVALLWGDSHAQAFSLGLKESLPEGMILDQVATSGCRPVLNQPKFNLFAANNNFRVACARSNRAALAAISRLNPEIVFMAHNEEQLSTDWEAIGRHLRRLGAKRVILLGPLPQWQPSLPLVVTQKHWPLRDRIIATGLSPIPSSVDRELRERARGWRAIEYISIVEPLCGARGCLAVVPGSLMALDYAHLTPAGSRYVGKAILKPAIQQLAR